MSETGLIVVVAVLAASAVFGLVRAARDGRLRSRRGDAALRFTAAELGGPLGERATFVQFSTSLCATCPGTRRLLGDLAARNDGVHHVDLDAEARLDLVRRAQVLRTPTVLVLDHRGRVVRRASGPMDRQAAQAALAAAIG